MHSMPSIQSAYWPAPIYPSRYGHESKAQIADFASRLACAEEIKCILRRRYARAVLQTVGESKEQFLQRSRAFWEEYALVGEKYVPEDPVYTGTRSGVALSTTADHYTLSSPSTGQVRTLEHFMGGEATASAVARVAIQRSTGGATPTNQTPEKTNTRSLAASSTFATTWTTQPTLSGVALAFHAFNAFGGQDRFVPQPGAEIHLVNAEILSCRSASGTSTVSSHVFWEEL